MPPLVKQQRIGESRRLAGQLLQTALREALAGLGRAEVAEPAGAEAAEAPPAPRRPARPHPHQANFNDLLLS